jgi:predicted nucleic acid-binding protein
MSARHEAAFLDTGYLLALELANDQHHQSAIAHWRTFRVRLPELVTTDYVFDEVVTFLNSRALHDKAVEVGNRLIQSPSVNLVHVDDDLFQSAWEYLQTHQDKTYSLTDCISFVLMGRLAITTALAFDQHFTQAGFERQP